MTVETEHLRLRNARTDDLDAVFSNIWSDTHLNEYMYWQNTFDINKAKERLDRTILWQKSHEYMFFVALKETDEVIGLGGIMIKEDGIAEEAGICIATEWQGKGYGKELLAALLALAFSLPDIQLFRYQCVSENDRSRNLCLGFGFEYEEEFGEIRERDGTLFVIESYLLLRSRYETLPLEKYNIVIKN